MPMRVLLNFYLSNTHHYTTFKYDVIHFMIRTTQINSQREVIKKMKKSTITNDLEEIKMSIMNKRRLEVIKEGIYSHNLRTYAQY